MKENDHKKNVEKESKANEKQKETLSDEQNNRRIQNFLGVFQAIASIATVIMAVLAWRTLIEMQTERNNAYRPELVIMPSTFEGGIWDSYNKRLDEDKQYTYFLYQPTDAIWDDFYSIISESANAYKNAFIIISIFQILAIYSYYIQRFTLKMPTIKESIESILRFIIIVLFTKSIANQLFAKRKKSDVI